MSTERAEAPELGSGTVESGADETRTGEASTGEASTVAPGTVAPDIAELEAEGDLAADYIEGLLDIADLDGDIDIDVANGRAYVSVTGGGEQLDRVAMPDVVQALQDLTRLAVQEKTGRFSRLIIDIGGSRDARAVELTRMVDAAIAQIAAGREQITLEPMSSYERKLVHDEVAQRGYHSESRGEGRDRRLVISRA